MIMVTRRCRRIFNLITVTAIVASAVLVLTLAHFMALLMCPTRTIEFSETSIRNVESRSCRLLQGFFRKLFSINFAKNGGPQHCKPLQLGSQQPLEKVFGEDLLLSRSNLIKHSTFKIPQLLWPIENRLFFNNRAIDFCLAKEELTGDYRGAHRIQCIYDRDNAQIIFKNFHTGENLNYGYTITLENSLGLLGGHVINCGAATNGKLTAIRNGGCDRNANQIKRLARVTHFQFAKEKKLIMIDHGWASSYYHYIIEGLSRFFLLANYQEIIKDPSYMFVVQRGHRKWPVEYFVSKSTFAVDIFYMMGVDRSRLYQVGEDEALLAQSMTLLSSSICSYSFPYATQKMQEYFWKVQAPFRRQVVLDLPSDCAPRNDSKWIVIIKRKLNRYVKNHNKMMQALRARFPCEVFKEFNEDHNSFEIYDLFSNAKIVMGPHGAGMSNIVFMEPPNSEEKLPTTHQQQQHHKNGPKRKALIEFNISSIVQFKAYSRLALIAGLRYYGLLFGDGIDGLSLFGFQVDLDVVVGTFEKALNYVNHGDRTGDKKFRKMIGEWRGLTDEFIRVNASVNF